VKTLKQNLLMALLVVVTNHFVYTQKSHNISPEDFGFSSQKLKEMEAVIQDHIDKKELAGVLTLIARRGEIVHFKTYGYQDMENKIEIQKSSIFRLASVTKIVTGVAALICYEEGLFLLDDPVKKYIPEFGNTQVFVSVQKGDQTDSLITEPLKRDITIRDLLRHTGGFAYSFENSPVDSLYKDAGFQTWSGSLSDFVKKIAEIPLAYQPGSKWRYSYSFDIVGYLIELVTKQPLDVFMEERIFKPLKMEDTGFYVPEMKLNRLTNYYEYKNDSLILMESPDNSPFRKLPSALSGGGGWFDGFGGLVTTAPDFSHFLQMVMNNGVLENNRILSPQSVELLITNQVHDIQDKSFLSGNYGYGLGVGASFKENNGPTMGIDWSGGPYNTRYWIDFENKIYGIFFAQTGPWGHLGIMWKFSGLAYQALIR
jgi:CubicO group peptidase (beta-lactamase class C family)